MYFQKKFLIIYKLHKGSNCQFGGLKIGRAVKTHYKIGIFYIVGVSIPTKTQHGPLCTSNMIKKFC